VVSGVKAVLNWFGGLGGLFSGWFNSAKNAASSALGGLVSFVGGLPGKILGGLGDMGSLLLNAGKSVVQGLISGISSLAGAVGHALVGLLPGPLQKFAGMLGIHSPSTVFAGFGKNMVQGLIGGIESSQGALMASMATLASTASLASLDSTASLAQLPSITPLGGGMLSSGGFAGNATGRSARISTPSQTSAVDRLIEALGRSQGTTAPTMNIEKYYEAQQPAHVIAANLAFMLRTA
jgi:hypothetical protein